MAFMNTPVTHGSGTLIVTATGAGTELGKISGMLSTTAREESPLTRELNRLTLWIAGAAGLTMVVMFVLGRARGAVAALECRSQTGTILTVDTFDSKQMNWALLIEFVLAVCVTQMDVLRRLLDTVPLNLQQFAWALVPPVALLIVWEAGKSVARRWAR